MPIPTNRQATGRGDRNEPRRRAAPKRAEPASGGADPETVPRLDFGQGSWGRLSHPDDVNSRARELSDHILGAPTPLEAVEAWCDYDAPDARVTYARCGRAGRDHPPEVVQALMPERGETIEARIVQIIRGARTVSEADEWFVPDRLPPHVRIGLRAACLPFAVAVRGLRPLRQVVSVEIGRRSAGSPVLLEHRVAYFDRDMRPLAIVFERYHDSLLN